MFGSVWMMLYAAMAVAAWLVWRRKGWAGARVPLTLFAVQLALNVVWPWLFFGLRNPELGLLDCIPLCAAIAATLVTFWRESVIAGLLLFPCLGWVTYAAALNYTIWQLNP